MRMNPPNSPPSKEAGFLNFSAQENWLHHADDYNYGSVHMRLLALAFDMIIVLFIMMLVVMLVYGQAWLLRYGANPSLEFYISLLLVPCLYFVGCWTFIGATPGKMLLGLSVVDRETGTTPGIIQAFIRFFGYGVNLMSFGLGVVGLLDSEQPQGWHDRLSGTVVISQQK